MKKIVSLLIVLAILASSAAVMVFATGNPVVTVSGASAEVGQQVTLEVSVSKVTMAMFETGLDFDTSALELVSIEKGAAAPANFEQNVDAKMVNGMSVDNYEAEGVLFTLTFNVLAAGTHTVTLVDCIIGDVDVDFDVTVNAGVISVAKAPCAPGEHTAEFHWEERGDCGTTGILAHYFCTSCGKLFADEECTVEVTEEELTFVPEHVAWDSEAWTEEGYILVTPICQYCEEVMGESYKVYFLYAEDCPTDITVPAGETVQYNGYGFAGYTMQILGDNLSVDVTVAGMWGSNPTTTTYTSVNGVVTIPVDGWQVRLAVTNLSGSDATYTVKVLIPVGDFMNPAALYVGTNTFEIAADNYYGYYTVFTPDHSGNLTVTVGGSDCWSFTVNIENDPDDWSDNVYGEEHAAYAGDSNTETVEVKAGFPVEVVLANYWMDESWNSGYPAGTLTVNVDFVPTHDIVHVEAKTPSCFEEGNIEYWYCSECGAAWADADLTRVTNLMSVKLGASCQNVKHVEAVEPTCETEGNIEYWYCEDCGQAWQDEARMQLTNLKNVILPATHKNIVHMEAVEPGCHYTGNVEHWYCADCDMVWVDEAMLQVSNHLSVILPALGGDVVHVEAAEATCTEAGHIEYWYCEECEQVWQNEELTQLTNRKNVITEAAKGHVYDDDKDMVCNVCEFDRTNSQTGDFTIVAAVAAAVISMTGIVALPVAKKKFF